MIFAAAAIVVAWGALLGAAYLSRTWLAVGRGAAALIVTLVYLSLAASAFMLLDLRWQAWAGAAGMLVPYVVALGLNRYRR